MLSELDRKFFDDNGYLIVPNAVAKDDCTKVVDAIFWFLEMDPSNSADWYREPLTPGGMIEMYQHQAMWNNRQNERVYHAFADLLQESKLCVTIDRVGMKPPRSPLHPTYDHHGFIHWDIDTMRLPQHLGLQGVLCLTDTEANMGGFQCIPGFHRDLEEWISQQPEDRNPRSPDLSRLPDGMKPTPIPAAAGDLIIWDTRLAHGNGHNTSQKPRFSQYISMFPASRLTDENRLHRINCWKHRMPPGGSVFPGDPRQFEQQFGQTAHLTPLGEKLLGSEPWHD